MEDEVEGSWLPSIIVGTIMMLIWLRNGNGNTPVRFRRWFNIQVNKNFFFNRIYVLWNMNASIDNESNQYSALFNPGTFLFHFVVPFFFMLFMCVFRFFVWKRESHGENNLDIEMQANTKWVWVMEQMKNINDKDNKMLFGCGCFYIIFKDIQAC